MKRIYSTVFSSSTCPFSIVSFFRFSFSTLRKSSELIYAACDKRRTNVTLFHSRKDHGNKKYTYVSAYPCTRSTIESSCREASNKYLMEKEDVRWNKETYVTLYLRTFR